MPVKEAVEAGLAEGQGEEGQHHDHPRQARRWRAPSAQLPDWKKAIVTLQPGQRIEFFES